MFHAVPDPNGEIVFEFIKPNAIEIVHCWEDGTAEYRQFVGTQLVEKRIIAGLCLRVEGPFLTED